MTNLTDYGFPSSLLPNDRQKSPARITAQFNQRYQLITPYGFTQGVLKAGTYLDNPTQLMPVVGDFVLIDYFPLGDSRITHTLPRTTAFSRLDPSSSGYKEQVVAANFNKVLIVQSLNQDFNLRRLERYLTLAWQSGASPSIVLTKADLMEDVSLLTYQVEAIAPGVPLFILSAHTGQGMEAFRQSLLSGETVVFLGSSGVGKSSLINALGEENLMTVNTIREDDGKGRHTTTHRQLIKLESGVLVIDTPGMRELGMWDVSQGLGQSFEDIEALQTQCHFANCSHGKEPHCAIKAALANGSLSEKRWKNYQSLLKQAKYTKAKERVQSLQETTRKNKKGKNKKPFEEKRQWEKEVALMQRQMKKR